MIPEFFQGLDEGVPHRFKGGFGIVVGTSRWFGENFIHDMILNQVCRR